MRTTYNTQFYCRKSKADKNNKAPLELSINIMGDRKFINLPCKLDVDDFNKPKQPQYIKDITFEWEKKVQESVTTLLNEGTSLTTENLRQIIRTGGKRTMTIEDAFNSYLKTLKKRVGVDLTYNAYRKYELTRDIFFEYANPKAELTTITPAMMQDFYAELNRKYKPNSSASYMSKLKTIIGHQRDNGYLPINPFQNIKIKREKGEIEYLTEEEMDKIATQEYSTEALKRVADVFLVQCYSGLSFVDLQSVRKEDVQVEDGVHYIYKKRHKTNVPYTAVIFPKGVEILEKYDYKLPIVSNQKTNSALKVIARECGIDKRVYDHLGRKSYGCMLLKRNVRMETVSKCLGHSTSRTTAAYYATLSTDTVLNEVSAAIKC